MINLDELRKQYEERLSKQNKQQNFNSEDSPFLKLEQGANFIRILPPKEESAPFYAFTKLHTIKEKNGNFKYWHCLTVHNEPCPLCDAYREIWNVHKKSCGKKDHKECNVPYGKAPNSIKPNERFYVNVVNRKDDSVKIASFPSVIWTKIMSAILGNKELGLEPNGDITDLQTGRDFNIVAIKQGEYFKYDQSTVKQVSTPAGSAAAIAKYMDSLHDLKAEVKKEDFAEMKKAADTILAGMYTVGISAAQDAKMLTEEEFKNTLKG